MKSVKYVAVRELSRDEIIAVIYTFLVYNSSVNFRVFIIQYQPFYKMTIFCAKDIYRLVLYFPIH